MAMEFVWGMTEENWKNFYNDHKSRDNTSLSKDFDFYGNCCVGNLCAEVMHTGDNYAWFAFVNVYGLGIDDGYGETKIGKIPYALLDDAEFTVPMECDTFENFKITFEKNFEERINFNDCLKELANMPLGDWS